MNAKTILSVHRDGFRRWLHEGLRGLRPDSAILAIGCEEAFLAPHLLEYAAEVTVLDTAGGQLAQLARRFPEISFLAHHPAKPLPFPAQRFDVICCCDFLDRVFDPGATLREIHRVLVPGGRLLVTVPDHGGVRKVLSALFRREQKSLPINPRLHSFNRRSLMQAMRQANFRDIQPASTAADQRARDYVPRRLLVRAKKGPEVLRTLPTAQAGQSGVGGLFGEEELAFAGRARAA